MKKTITVLGTLAFFGAAPLASAQVVTFTEIADTGSASDTSPDGRWVVGSGMGSGYRLDTWSGAITIMPSNSRGAVAVSNDGSVVLCNMDNPVKGDGDLAGIWTAGTGLNDIGFLPNALNCPSKSSAYELSADGTVAVGLSWDGCSGRGFRWTQATGMVEMSDATGNGGCRASVVSGAGSLLGGFCQASTRTPVVWDGLTGIGNPLDPEDLINGEVYGISDDGSHILGSWGGQGFVFDDQGGQEFFSGVVGPWSTAPTDIADNGTIVGFDFSGQSRAAWIRPEGALPATRLTTYLTELGGTPPPSLDVATKVSADGRIITGQNFFGSGWIMNLCRPDFDGDGIIGFSDLLRILSDWGNTSSQSPADLDDNDDIGFGDLLVVLSAWGPCPASVSK